MSTLTYQRDLGRRRRQKRVRKKVLGTDDLPRICIFRSLKHIYVQVISDEKGATLVSTSTLSKELKDKMQRTKGMEAAKEVGAQIARMCKDKGITKAVFDRNGFLCHGRVKALAEAAREGGLQL